MKSPKAAAQAQKVQVAANFSMEPLEVVHRNGTDSSVMSIQHIPINTAVPVAGGLGPAPIGRA